MTVSEHDLRPRADRAGAPVPRAHARARLPIEPADRAETRIDLADARVGLGEPRAGVTEPLADRADARVDLDEAERLVSDLAALVDAGLIVVRPNALGPARYEVAA